MSHYLPRQGQAQAQEQGGPIHGMKPEDFLANEMDIGRPVTPVPAGGTVINGRDIVAQSVDPDINHMLGIRWKWNPPAQRGAADGKVFQAILQLAKDIALAFGRLNERRICLEELWQRICIFGKPEEVGRL